MDNRSGVLGEKYAEKYLRKRKYKILDRNFRSKYGEIDIIACDLQYIIFVEVKTREENSLVSGQEAVHYQKQQKIIKTAMCYLQLHPTNLQPRFDVAVISTKQGQKLIHSIEWITDAFQGSGY